MINGMDNTCFFIYKHMKFRIQARLAIYDFEAHNMLSLCLTLQGTKLLV